MLHAVSRLRTARLARSAKPFLARGGFKRERCPGCRLVPTHCLCALRPMLNTQAGVCLLMADIEPLKPTNTGWLIADVVPQTFAYGWARTEVDPELLALLNDPQWQPYVVFPGQYAAPERVVSQVQIPQVTNITSSDCATSPVKRPLFVLLDATWTEARKMFRRSPYLDRFPVLSLEADQVSQYKLRRTAHEGHLCTSEVAGLCMHLAGEHLTAQVLQAYLGVFTHHYLQAKNQQPVDWEGAAHQRWRAVQSAAPLPCADPTAEPGHRTEAPTGSA